MSNGPSWKLMGFLEHQIVPNVEDQDKVKFMKNLKGSDALNVSCLILMFAIYDDFNDSIGFQAYRKKRKAEGKPTFQAPTIWRYKIPFDEFSTAVSAAFFEARATRNAWVHNSGRRGTDYNQLKREYFKKLGSTVSSFNRMNDGENFGRVVDPFIKRSNVKRGGKLPVDLEYLMAVQFVLIDRIALESGYYRASTRSKKKYLGGTGFDFELSSPFS